VAPEEDAQAQEAQASEARAPQAQVSGLLSPAFLPDFSISLYAARQRRNVRATRESFRRACFQLERVVALRAKVLSSPAASTLIGLIF
jgi:hypothetical protein